MSQLPPSDTPEFQAPIPRVRASAIVSFEDHLLCVQFREPSSGALLWGIPGGAIDADETAPEAAEREVLEETGVEVLVDPASCDDREYLFKWGTKEFDCLTLFYRAEVKNKSQVLGSAWKDFRHSQSEFDADLIGSAWIPTAEALDQFSWLHSEVRDAIHKLLGKPSPRSLRVVT